MPQKWYPRGPDGSISKFDDLPAAYRRNVEFPATLRPARRRSASLSDADIQDIVAFLNTLTDGFEPGSGENVARGQKTP